MSKKLEQALGALAMLAMVTLSFTCGAQGAEMTATQPNLIFLCIGQSNMAGRAPLIDGDEDPMDGVLLLNREYEWEPARQPLNRYAVNPKIKKNRFSPAGPFALALREANTQVTIGLMVNARGSTSIEQWGPNGLYYKSSLERAQKIGPLSGVLWLQGYHNRNDPDYLRKLTSFITRLREDLGQPDLPFIASQIAAKGSVNDAIASLPSAVPMTAFVSNEGTGTVDGAHFDRDSQILIGERFAQAYLKLVVDLLNDAE